MPWFGLQDIFNLHSNSSNQQSAVLSETRITAIHDSKRVPLVLLFPMRRSFGARFLCPDTNKGVVVGRANTSCNAPN